jgi:hypothetical protein
MLHGDPLGCGGSAGAWGARQRFVEREQIIR